MMADNLYWLGHASFRLDGSKRIYFDPYQLPQNSPRADIICITHEHFDHCSLDDIALITTMDTVIISDKAAARKLQNAKVLCREVRFLSPGDNIEIGNIKISAVASYNTNKQFHTKDSHKLGFIVTIDGVKIYHAGDTDLIPEMKNYFCDIALLPVGGTYTMTPDEAAQAALIIKPKLVIPMHYGSVVGSDTDAKRLQDLLKGKIEVKIFKKES
jgi:L-ascorbate metabolism protein UlaG (beta-lactamase superfamily)